MQLSDLDGVTFVGRDEGEIDSLREELEPFVEDGLVDVVDGVGRIPSLFVTLTREGRERAYGPLFADAAPEGP